MTGTTPNVGLQYAVPGDQLALFPTEVDQPRAVKLDALLAPGSISLSRMAALTLANSTNTPLLFDTTDSVSANMTYAAATGLVTVALAGRYLVSASLGFTAGGTSYRQIRLMKNGAIWGYRQYPIDATMVHTAHITTIMALAAGNTIGIQYYGSAGSLNVANPYKLNVLDVHRLPS